MQYDYFSISQGLKATHEGLELLAPKLEDFVNRKAVPGAVAGMFALNALANGAMPARPFYTIEYFTNPAPAAIPYQEAPVERIPGVWNMILSTNTSSATTTSGTTTIFNLSGDHPPAEISAIHQDSLPISYHAVPPKHYEQFVNGHRLEIV